jgi:hypothetical protein
MSFFLLCASHFLILSFDNSPLSENALNHYNWCHVWSLANNGIEYILLLSRTLYSFPDNLGFGSRAENRHKNAVAK